MGYYHKQFFLILLGENNAWGWSSKMFKLKIIDATNLRGFNQQVMQTYL